jgi:hypothetical protein
MSAAPLTINVASLLVPPAPSTAWHFEIAAPIPRDPPVTSAVVPSTLS